MIDVDNRFPCYTIGQAYLCFLDRILTSNQPRRKHLTMYLSALKTVSFCDINNTRSFYLFNREMFKNLFEILRKKHMLCVRLLFFLFKKVNIDIRDIHL